MTGLFKVIEVKPMTIKIEEDGIPNSLSIHRATRGPAVKFAERLLLYIPEGPSGKRGDKADQGEGNTIAEDLASVPRKYAVDWIVCHVCEADNIRYVVCWSGYTSVSKTVDLSKHIPEHFIICYWRRLNKK